jgi:GNAT superfamily N-acetyltransferase
MIRVARPEDLRPIVRLAIQIFEEAFPFDLNEDHAVNALAMIMFGNGYVRVAEAGGEVVGFLVGTISASGFWSQELCAVEAKFGIHPDYRGGKLARAFMCDFEAWAKSMGVNTVVMACETDLSGDRVGKLYERGGYVASETVYRKSV